MGRGAASRSRSGGSMAGDGRRPETIATIQKATMIHGEGRTARPLRVLTTNADDRLPVASLGRVEGGDGFVEGRDVADVRPQSSVPHPLDDLTQLGTIGLDNEVDRQAVGEAQAARGITPASPRSGYSPAAPSRGSRECAGGCRRGRRANAFAPSDAT